MSLRNLLEEDGWIGGGFWVFVFSLCLLGIASISEPPRSLLHTAGTVVAIDDKSPRRAPKFNIYVKDGDSVVRLYTDLGLVRKPVLLGDSIVADYAEDIFGRNFYRVWDLRRNGEVLLSKDALVSRASVEAGRGALISSCGIAVGAVLMVIGWLRRARLRTAP